MLGNFYHSAYSKCGQTIYLTATMLRCYGHDRSVPYYWHCTRRCHSWPTRPSVPSVSRRNRWPSWLMNAAVHLSRQIVHWQKFADFTLPHLYLAPPLGVTPFKFRKNFWHQKTRVPVALFVWSYLLPFWYNTGLWWTDRQTDGHTTTANTALTASRGKNDPFNSHRSANINQQWN